MFDLHINFHYLIIKDFIKSFNLIDLINIIDLKTIINFFINFGINFQDNIIDFY